MISLLAAPMNAEDLISAPIHVADNLHDDHATHTSNSLVARIHWCQEQQVKARTEVELEEWYAEEDGLQDALLHMDRTSLYQDRPPIVLERYVMGLEDGRVLIRAACVESVWQPTI